MLVILMKYMVHDVHSSWKIIWKRYGPTSSSLKHVQIRSHIRFHISLSIRDNHSKNPTGLKHPQAIRQKAWEFFQDFQVLDKLLSANSDGALISQRQAATAVPSHDLR